MITLEAEYDMPDIDLFFILVNFRVKYTQMREMKLNRFKSGG
jgi:hypothetical protein